MFHPAKASSRRHPNTSSTLFQHNFLYPGRFSAEFTDADSNRRNERRCCGHDTPPRGATHPGPITTPGRLPHICARPQGQLWSIQLLETGNYGRLGVRYVSPDVGTGVKTLNFVVGDLV